MGETNKDSALARLFGFRTIRRRVGAMISLTNAETIMEQIIQVLTVALPEDTDSSENVVAPDPQ